MDRNLIDNADFTKRAPKVPLRDGGKFDSLDDKPSKMTGPVRALCAVVAAAVILWAASELLLNAFSFMGGHQYTWPEFGRDLMHYRATH